MKTPRAPEVSVVILGYNEWQMSEKVLGIRLDGVFEQRSPWLRDVTTVEIRDLRHENERLKQFGAQLSLVNLTLRTSLSYSSSESTRG